MMASRPRPARTARKGPRPLRLALALVAVVVLALPGTVVAGNRTVVVHDQLDFTVQLPLLTNFCGYPVFSRFVGTLTAVVQYDADGFPDWEVDSGVLERTIFAPSTGRSISFPLQQNARVDYQPDGSGIADVSGLFVNAHTAGGGPLLFGAGREVWSVQIAFIRPDGVPIVDFLDLLEKVGGGQGDITAICAALDA